jgi:folate-dependent phosphoribosylglycinamide formyltransferase PurN
MRLIVNGQQAFCKATIDAIVEKGTDEIVAVYTAPDKEGRPVDAAKEAAEAHGIPCIQPDNYSDAAVLEEMRSFDADLMVMAYMIIFVPEEARNVPKHGSICFHPSLLPAHRGPSSINWPIIWGRTETGLTIFEAYGRTGKVHAIDDDGFVITAGLGGVKVGRVRPAGGKKMAAKDYERKFPSDPEEIGSPIDARETLPRRICGWADAARLIHRPEVRQGQSKSPAKPRSDPDFINDHLALRHGQGVAGRQADPGHRDQPDARGRGQDHHHGRPGDGLNRIGKKAAICIREASLGPCFGMKGGAAGGGYAQVVPMEDMNLHFTGDFHAITSAHNLLRAMIDNHIYWGNELGIDVRRVAWRRVVDMNDRALRQIVLSLGGVANGFPRETGFDITVASEVMAILCLANDLKTCSAPRRHRRRLPPRPQPDLLPRHQGRRRDDRAAEGRAAAEPGADAGKQPGLRPRRPVRQHRPRLQLGRRHQDALKLADYVVTEAGFGADLGAEKFFDIKCRKAGLTRRRW